MQSPALPPESAKILSVEVGDPDKRASFQLNQDDLKYDRPSRVSLLNVESLREFTSEFTVIITKLFGYEGWKQEETHKETECLMWSVHLRTHCRIHQESYRMGH